MYLSGKRTSVGKVRVFYSEKNENIGSPNILKDGTEKTEREVPDISDIQERAEVAHKMSNGELKTSRSEAAGMKIDGTPIGMPDGITDADMNDILESIGTEKWADSNDLNKYIDGWNPAEQEKINRIIEANPTVLATFQEIEKVMEKKNLLSQKQWRSPEEDMNLQKLETEYQVLQWKKSEQLVSVLQSEYTTSLRELQQSISTFTELDNPEYSEYIQKIRASRDVWEQSMLINELRAKYPDDDLLKKSVDRFNDANSYTSLLIYLIKDIKGIIEVRQTYVQESRVQEQQLQVQQSQSSQETKQQNTPSENEWYQVVLSPSELSSTVSKPIQTLSGQIFQARLVEWDVIVHDPTLTTPDGSLNLGKQEEFAENSKILEMGMKHPILQNLFLNANLELVKKHMRHIENALQRQNLTIEQYTVQLLTQIISLSWVDKDNNYSPSFDATILPRLDLYFQENKRDIQAGLIQSEVATPEYGLIPMRFLNKLPA